jgi:membrane complex biogenesis BtpA family protein
VIAPVWGGLVGVVHLPPLPGSPRPSPGLARIVERARADVVTLVQAGFDGLIVENLGDAPFDADEVAVATVAQMTRVVLAAREAAPSLCLGVNVLRNDALAALAVAAATCADFIRVNVHSGVMVADQGVLTGRARQTLLERNRLGAAVRVIADVHVKHAVPLGAQRLADVAHDTWSRSGVDALVVSGAGTGRPTSAADVLEVRAAAPGAPVWVGSGTSPTCPRPGDAVGVIVGSWLHHDGDLDAPLDPARCRAMREAFDAASR